MKTDTNPTCPNCGAEANANREALQSGMVAHYDNADTETVEIEEDAPQTEDHEIISRIRPRTAEWAKNIGAKA